MKDFNVIAFIKPNLLYMKTMKLTTASQVRRNCVEKLRKSGILMKEYPLDNNMLWYEKIMYLSSRCSITHW